MDHAAQLKQNEDDVKLKVVTVKNELVPDSFLDAETSPRKRSIKSEATDGLPWKRPKMEFLGVILPARKRPKKLKQESLDDKIRTTPSTRHNTSNSLLVVRDRRSRASYSISPGPGDTDSESGSGDEKLAKGRNDIGLVVVAPAPVMMRDEKHFKAKVKKDMELDDETIQKRIDRIGCPTIKVVLDIQLKTVSRKFLSMSYGGSPQEVFPKIGAANLARHNREHWMLFSPLLHPHAPQLPGEPGVWYRSSPYSPDYELQQKVHHTFVRIESGKWRYLGGYRCYVAEPLTQIEWLFQSKEVRRTWGTNLHKAPWGRRVRAMIKLRKQLKREPNQTEIDEALKTTNKFMDITAQQIEKAFDMGEQRLGLMVLKCIHYDEGFQHELVQKFSVWDPPPPKTKPKRKVGQKAKIDKEEVEVAEAEVVEMENSDDNNLDFQSEVIIHRGTRTRPVNA